MLNKTRLIGNVYAKHEAASQEECFDMCDADSKCAAACFCITTSKCNLHKFGFTTLQVDIEQWSSYIKPAVVNEQDILKSDVQVVKESTRFVNSYDSFDTLTPSQCFKQCKAKSGCGAASFTTDIKQAFNCFFFKSGEFTASDDKDMIDSWSSYSKEPIATSSSTTLKSASLISVIKKKSKQWDINNGTDFGEIIFILIATCF
jgi:hypothetical protein